MSIGIYIGTMLDRDKLLRTKRLVPNVLVGSLLMVGTSAVVAVIIGKAYGYSPIGAFLAVAPGGIAEMCLAGMEMSRMLHDPHLPADPCSHAELCRALCH